MDTTTKARRARRADAGLVRTTERDLRLLRTVGEQYALTVPQLARLMGRSVHAGRWLRERWQRAGWVNGRALLVGQPPFVWLTRRGLNAARLHYPVWRPNPGALRHLSVVTDVRLHVQQRHPGAEWVSERDLAHTGSGAAVHRPDGLVVIEGRAVAVEVELTQKEGHRAARIMGELTATYASVTYFAAPAPRRLLTVLADEIGDGRVQVLPLPEEVAL
jgi:hypothetical protein